eukprot:m.663643 g.663643  ORF g.663643 m.663643 type:complete len:391 (+) comp22744_c0_seq4:553-1725(+)
MTYVRSVQSFALPFPTQKVAPFMATIIGMHRLRERETPLDLAKIELLLQEGADPNELDAYGRTALCYCSSAEMTKLLLSAGADPNIVVPPDALVEYATGIAGRAYVDNLLQSLTVLKNEAYPSTGTKKPEAAEIMADAVLRLKHHNVAAAHRCLVSGCPLAEALSEGKIGKAQALLEGGAQPLVSLPSVPAVQLDLSWFVAEGSAALESFVSRTGQAVWEGLALRLLWFTRFYVPPTSARGSQLLRASHAQDQVQQFEGGFHGSYTDLLELLVNAEATLPPLAAGDVALDPYEPTVQEQMECEELTRNALTTLPFPDGQTYALTEEDVAVNQIVLSANRARAMCVPRPDALHIVCGWHTVALVLVETVCRVSSGPLAGIALQIQPAIFLL